MATIKQQKDNHIKFLVKLNMEKMRIVFDFIREQKINTLGYSEKEREILLSSVLKINSSIIRGYNSDIEEKVLSKNLKEYPTKKVGLGEFFNRFTLRELNIIVSKVK